MIKGNVLEFGYGDIGVVFGIHGLQFTQIKPPVEIGATLNPEYCKKYEVELGKTYYLDLDLKEISLLQNKLDDVTEANCVFEFNEWVFDFTKYNEESVNVVKRKLKQIPAIYLLPYAC